MRIIDKNTDFYDYLQNVYPDNTTTFDRTDSFELTKELFCEHLDCRDLQHYCKLGCSVDEFNHVLLQVCNTFWLFKINFTQYVQEYSSIPDKFKVSDYNIELLGTWKDYSKPRTLIKLNRIYFPLLRLRFKTSQDLIDAINHSDYEERSNFCSRKVYLDGYYLDKSRVKEKHIPLLKSCSLSQFIDPLEIYLAFDEYFAKEKTVNERDASIDITDKEKTVNHGFNLKDSFRGKRSKK